MRSHCRGDAEWQAYRPVDIDARPVKCQLARFKSNISYCLQLCSSDNRSAENTACQYCHPVAIALLCIRCQRRWTLFLRRLMTAGYLTSICIYQFQTAASFATWREHRHFHSRWLPVGISPLLWGVGNHRVGQWCVNSEFHTLLKSKVVGLLLVLGLWRVVVRGRYLTWLGLWVLFRVSIYGRLIKQCKSKFKPENPGLQAAKTRVFGFEKNAGNPGFRVR